MKNKIISKMLFIYIVCYTSCINKPNKDKLSLKPIIEKVMGDRLQIPDSLYLYNPFPSTIKDSIEIANSKLKIYSYINASCSTCVPNIKKWDSLISEFKEHKVPIILVCGSEDKFELIKHLCESGDIKKFSYPLFFDKENKYIKINKFMNESIHFQTVLTDKDNNILLLGNPLYSTDIKKMFIETIIKNQKS